MILRNHGLLVAAVRPGETIYYLSTLERACEIQIAALSGESLVRTISEAALRQCDAVLAAVNGGFSRDWAAMLRLVEKVAPDYRD